MVFYKKEMYLIFDYCKLNKIELGEATANVHISPGLYFNLLLQMIFFFFVEITISHQ